ncbi:Late embryogenesis abundant (LEA) protein-related, putative [Theobroma cacao]|uniref:Late embryogenesis abundant (LEA) protein-related, putative n=1 Tax=Theobroma cacao TaxID=3641 RepID=A0A061FEB5_THECC|nr:Late embryogenesis abundant (LEA) protein-related, putative [Theobroma cacao]
MEIIRSSFVFIILLVFVSGVVQSKADSVRCRNPASRCYGKYIECPYECPSTSYGNQKAKVYRVNCDSPVCKSYCKHRKPNCNGPGSASYDPRFIGGDGVVFYFHGKSNKHSAWSPTAVSKLVAASSAIALLAEPGTSLGFKHLESYSTLAPSPLRPLRLQHGTVNSRMCSLRLVLPEKDVKVERVANKNSVIVTLKDSAEIMVNVVPVTKEDDRIHNYKVPSDDCFAHLEVQFRFFALSPEVDGVLGRTYRPDFENPAKPGVAMPVVGGEDNYRTTSLLSADCSTCLFSPESGSNQETTSVTEYLTLDCSRGASAGYGIVCKK